MSYNRAWHTIGTQRILLSELNWNRDSYCLASHISCLQLNDSTAGYFMSESENERVRDVWTMQYKTGHRVIKCQYISPILQPRKRNLHCIPIPGCIDWITDCYPYNGSSFFWGWESHSSLNAIPFRKSYLFYQQCWEFISTVFYCRQKPIMLTNIYNVNKHGKDKNWLNLIGCLSTGIWFFF